MEIRELLNEYNIRYKDGSTHKNVRDGWLGINCPYCGEHAEKYHLGINLEEGFANCWQCGSHSIIKVIANISNIPFSIVKKKLGRFGQRAQNRAEIAPHGRIQAPQGLVDIGSQETKYLENRGFSASNIIKLWDIKATAKMGRLKYRIWIPVHFNGQLVTWTTRTIGDNRVRYLHAPPQNEELPIKKLLYGEDYVRHSIIVTEGPLDVWAIGPGAVATFGLAYTKEQLLRISKYPIRSICFDAELAAQKKSVALYNELRGFPGQTNLIHLETGNDPAECNSQEIQEIRRKFL